MSRRAPVIGITADLAPAGGTPIGSRGEITHVLPHRYCRAIESAGGIPLILPATHFSIAARRILDLVEGLVISGGDFDIHPRYYGEKPMTGLGVIKQDRTEFELALTAEALKRDLPILGICGGEQAINVALGGSLYQDIAEQLVGVEEHQLSDRRETGGHGVRVHDGTRLRAILGRKTLEVNSTHHQAIKVIGKGLIVNATAEDGLIEGIESQEHRFVLGLQWHPEVLAPRRKHQRRIFSAFITACKRRTG